MGRKKKKNIQNTKESKKEEREISPFDGIVLKEKKTPDKVKQPAVNTKAKKPSEIVQGYNPNMSFADILYSYEKTGNPYSMPKPKASKTEVKEDFGAILDKWEGKSNVQRRVESVKNEYKPTKSFADILSTYEKSNAKEKKNDRPQDSRNKKDSKVNISTLFREEDEDNKVDSNASWSIIGGKNNSFVRKEAREIEDRKITRASKPYKPNIDFSEILDEFDGKSKKKITEKKVDEISVSIEEAAIIKKTEEIIPPPNNERFFRCESEENQKAPNVSWSIIGGKNEAFIRPVPEKKEPIDENIKKQEYKPTKEFSEILSSYEKKKEESIKTFDEILKEKGDNKIDKPKYSITKLRTMPPQATLDLHGETQQKAEEIVNSFLKESVDSGLRKICIITGKGLHSDGGEGVIRPLVERILEESGVVSEKNNAPLNAGGSGALWIILKA